MPGNMTRLAIQIASVVAALNRIIRLHRMAHLDSLGMIKTILTTPTAAQVEMVLQAMLRLTAETEGPEEAELRTEMVGMVVMAVPVIPHLIPRQDFLVVQVVMEATGELLEALRGAAAMGVLAERAVQPAVLLRTTQEWVPRGVTAEQEATEVGVALRVLEVTAVQVVGLVQAVADARVDQKVLAGKAETAVAAVLE